MFLYRPDFNVSRSRDRENPHAFLGLATDIARDPGAVVPITLTPNS